MARRVREDDLLAFIEGDLPDDRQAEIRRALEGEPDLLAWAEGARADRAALQEWGRPGATIAPPDLVEQAMRQAERDALLGAAGLDDAPAPRVLFRFTGPRTALAAMLLAALGLGFIYGPTLVQQWRTGGAPSMQPEALSEESGALALDDADGARMEMSGRANEEAPAVASAPREVDALGAVPVERRQRDDARFAMADREIAKTSTPMAEEGVDANGVPMRLALAPTASGDEAAGAVSTLRAIGAEAEVAQEMQAAQRALSLDAAAELARHRRLVVRIEAPRSDAVETALRTDAEGRFRIAPLAQVEGAPARLLVETPPGPAGLNALLDALGAIGATSVQMRERAEALPAPAPADAADVLWWTRPAGSWPGMGSAVEVEIIAPPPRLPPLPGD